MGRYPWEAGERTRIVLLAATSVGAILYPLRQYLRAPSERVDGFPLSYYPMFSKRRKKNAKVVHARCVHADGTHHPLSHDVLGSGGFNQVRHQLNRLAGRGQAQACATALAARLPRQPRCRNAERVEIVRLVVDVDACMTSRRIAGRETILASANLPDLRVAT